MRLKNKYGMVFLVGAGPGDPGLLTLKAKDCLETGDLIIYDNLANRAFLKYARETAEKIYVGKTGGYHSKSQDEINQLIVEKAKQGLNIVRLKGGDPFIFGRGGEEAEELVKAGILFEIVPGITSAIAVPAYAGIPLTHRDYTSTVAFITGHEDPTKEESSIDWAKLATGPGTLVFLMGVGNLAGIAEKLINHGRPKETPLAVIERGTVPEQRTITGTLENIARLTEEAGVQPPAIIVVGDVVDLRESLNWFETRPLFGKRIVVTRAREQASEFLSLLSGLGAECLEFPSIEIIQPENWNTLDRAIQDLETYQWLLFTSVNGVKYFFERMGHHQKDVRDLKGIKVGVIGPKTAEAILKKGIKPDLIPQEYRAEAIIQGMSKEEIKGAKILLPRAEKAREILPRKLESLGAKVDVIPVYRTIKPDQDLSKIKEMLKQGRIDLVTFTSSSTVSNFIEMFEPDVDSLKIWMKKVTVACIGPITAEKAKEKGLSVDIMPKDYTIEALAESILDYFSNQIGS
jgi:uroporphyrinogen III methyltransferase/synthase